jgi:hypothetical protein
MTRATPIILDPVLTDDDAARLLELRASYGPYRFALGSHARYFRETYVYGGTVFLPGIEFLVEHEGIAEAARELHQRDIVVPAIVYANILVPGQRLEVHTDLPEYRGADRRSVPQWLLLVMQHAGLFERWRLPIATAITYVGAGRGGAFTYYPTATGPAQSYLPRHNTALLIDVDSIFHGVDVVEGDDTMARTFRPGVQLEAATGDAWVAKSADGSRILAEYQADDLRYSVSWKAYCFADEAEQAMWQDHSDDLTVDLIEQILIENLDREGLLPGGVIPGSEREFRTAVEAVYGATSWRDAELRRAEPQRASTRADGAVEAR